MHLRSTGVSSLIIAFGDSVLSSSVPFSPTHGTTSLLAVGLTVPISEPGGTTTLQNITLDISPFRPLSPTVPRYHLLSLQPRVHYEHEGMIELFERVLCLYWTHLPLLADAKTVPAQHRQVSGVGVFLQGKHHSSLTSLRVSVGRTQISSC